MSIASSVFDSWDPFQHLRSLAESHPAFAGESMASANTRLDWKETPTAHVVKADMPGVGKKDVKVEIVDGRILQISGRRREEEGGGKEETWHCAERRGAGGEFLRRVRLPDDADVDRVKARMEDGVLTVTVPKVEEAEKRGRVRAVEIVGGDRGKKGKKGVLCFGIGK